MRKQRGEKREHRTIIFVDFFASEIRRWKREMCDVASYLVGVLVDEMSHQPVSQFSSMKMEYAIRNGMECLRIAFVIVINSLFSLFSNDRQNKQQIHFK